MDGCAVPEHPTGFEASEIFVSAFSPSCCVPESSACPAPDRAAFECLVSDPCV